ncbi:MAG: flavodoxin family protein [Actinobacteria bacterium]|nr:flavodoxin family protein [Actinomycetota bacterium]
MTVLGIAGSPRRNGNTEFLVEEALKAAEEVPGVTTRFASLAGKKINPCPADYLCFKQGTAGIPCPTYKDDDCNEILRMMLEADGVIVASPVYYGGPTAQIKALFDRSMACEALGFKLRNKVCGAISVAYDRNGGQESTIVDMIRWAMTHDMIVVSVGPDRPGKTGIGCYYGAVVTQGFPYPVSSPTPEGHRGARQDEIGLHSVRGIGKRVAEVAKLVKTSLAGLPDSELGWPKDVEADMVKQYGKI